MIIFFIIMFILIVIASYAWVRGISNMQKNHPEYKGEDFLNWDDNEIHSEGNF